MHRITDEAQLREIIGGDPTETVVVKIADHINELTRRFIELSPFLCVGTAAPDGGLDVSPRGDPAGFVQVLDERTLLLLPERPGNTPFGAQAGSPTRCATCSATTGSRCCS